MTKSLQQVVIKTGAWTLFFAFTAFGYGLALFGLVFPKVMADFAQSLGSANMAGMYYERIYNANKTSENAYIALEQYIIAENHKKVVQFAGEFLSPDGIHQGDYIRIIKAANKAGYEAAAGNKLNMLKWGNEDSRIKSAYMVALLAGGEFEVAKPRLLDWLKPGPDLLQPNYAFFAFVWADRVDEEIRGLFAEYVDAFEGAFDFDTFEGEPIFAVDFLRMAYTYLEDSKASHYAELFYELI